MSSMKYVTDPSRALPMIQIFDQRGKFLDEWTQFGRPSGIAITSDDTIYVADSESWGPDEPGWLGGRLAGARQRERRQDQREGDVLRDNL